MPGQRAVQKQQAAAIESGIMTFRLTPTAQRTGLFIAERKTVIESVLVRFATNAGGARTGHLAYVPSGTAMSGTNFDITTTDQLDFGGTADTNQTATLNSTNGAPIYNVVPEGSLVFLELNGAVGTLADLIITIRYTTVTI